LIPAGDTKSSARSYFYLCLDIFSILNGDIMAKLGNTVDFDFSSTAVNNLNKLLKLIKSRLSSTGKAKASDKDGNTTYVDLEVFSNEMLVDFLVMSLSDFNQTPYFTSYTFDDTLVVDTFSEVLVEGATLQALASKALIERGREFQIVDNGVHFNPPSVSDLMNTQYCTLINHHFDKLKVIKSTTQIFEFKKKNS
jgi:hypothetical protein